MNSMPLIQSLLAGDEGAVETLVRSYQRPVFLLALTILDDGAGEHPGPQVIAEAEAAAQDTFMTALDSLNRYREDTPFDIWLYRFAVRAARRRVRLRGVRQAAGRVTGAVARRVAGARTGSGAANFKPLDLSREVELPHRREESAAETAGAETAGAGTPDAPVRAGHGPAPTVPAGTADDDLWQAVRGLNESLRLPVVLRYYHDFSVEQIALILRKSEGAVHARLDAARESLAAREQLAARENLPVQEQPAGQETAAPPEPQQEPPDEPADRPAAGKG